VPSDKPTQSKIDHEVLGPGVAIYDDHHRTGLRRIAFVFMALFGVIGLVWLARADLMMGNTLLGVAEVAGSLTIFAYSVYGVVADTRRLRSEVRLVVARGGFALLPPGQPVSWDEVASIGDPRSPAGDPKIIRVVLKDPAAYEKRHGVTLLGHLNLLYNRGTLILGSGMGMPLKDVEKLMRSQLAEFRGIAAGGTAAPVRAPKPKRGASKPRS
jgi:hypothetical protein